jgi:hypothetical protein
MLMTRRNLVSCLLAKNWQNDLPKTLNRPGRSLSALHRSNVFNKKTTAQFEKHAVSLFPWRSSNLSQQQGSDATSIENSRDKMAPRRVMSSRLETHRRNHASTLDIPS